MIESWKKENISKKTTEEAVVVFCSVLSHGRELELIVAARRERAGGDNQVVHVRHIGLSDVRRRSVRVWQLHVQW
jgi:hypothetical protein